MRLDEETLQAIADITHGAYFHAGTAEDLKKVYQDLSARLILERKDLEITFLFAAAAAVLLLRPPCCRSFGSIRSCEQLERDASPIGSDLEFRPECNDLSGEVEVIARGVRRPRHDGEQSLAP